MPLFVLPLVLMAAFALWVVLLPVSVVQRYRAGRARRRVQPWFVAANAWLLALSALMFLAAAWVLGAWVDDAARDAAAGLCAGVAAGVVGLRFDRLEWTDRGLYRTPNRAFLLALTLLLAARIALGIWLALGDATLAFGAAWLDRGGLLAVAGVLLGHAAGTAWGLRRTLGKRVAQHPSA